MNKGWAVVSTVMNASGVTKHRNFFSSCEIIDLSRMAVWMVGWLVGWLAGWLAGWLVDWLVGWLVGWMVG